MKNRNNRKKEKERKISRKNRKIPKKENRMKFVNKGKRKFKVFETKKIKIEKKLPRQLNIFPIISSCL